ncbi:hypothetical protein ZIOFF_012929 [Zingiber officinale]|uniref:Subtilisin-like protease fibronectin type-III domain-containing protein n=1 Tax=Zingiber officinale TaxID=94328 RepID=A0A8J5HF84_ZINOF|nr:hypothetical protein ZIOFF_012929 [Zingiber officinale]
MVQKDLCLSEVSYSDSRNGSCAMLALFSPCLLLESFRCLSFFCEPLHYSSGRAGSAADGREPEEVARIFPSAGRRGVWSRARNIAREVTKCSKSVIEEELNYPSILLAPRGRAAAKVTRTVTNVGLAKSSYTVSVSISKTVVSTTVTPETLTFNELNEQKSFTVSVKWGANGPPTSGNNQFVEGKLTWTSDDGKHVVTSPFIVSAY